MILLTEAVYCVLHLNRRYHVNIIHFGPVVSKKTVHKLSVEGGSSTF